MGTPGRFSVEERRRSLLELGLELFSSRPYDDISIEEIARTAGMSKGLLYHYFPSKRDFYVECLRAVKHRFQIDTEPDPELPPVEQLRSSLSGYLDHMQKHHASYKALLRGGIGSDPEVIEIYESSRRLVMDRVLVGNGAADDHGILRIAVRGWICFCEEAAVQWAEAGGADKEELLAVLVAVLTTAIRESRAVVNRFSGPPPHASPSPLAGEVR
jgi:AcrR family transcriptional regulator